MIIKSQLCSSVIIAIERVDSIYHWKHDALMKYISSLRQPPRISIIGLSIDTINPSFSDDFYSSIYDGQVMFY